MHAGATSTLIMTANIHAFAAPAVHTLPALLGNPCHVDLMATAPGCAAPTARAGAYCISWPSGDNSARVRCWNSQGNAIQCCGHGLLSCASLWLPRWRGNGHLIMSGTRIACRNQGGMTWLGFPTLKTSEQPCPPWVTAQLGVAASTCACASAGGTDGYLIIQLPRGHDLALLPVPDASLATLTQRALIVTCQAPHATSAYAEDIHFRYFAPQYGEPEDSATGSAMRVLASYWQRNGLTHPLRAIQRSARGGLLASAITADTTWVGGLALTEEDVRA